ncbi:UHRF1-binding protein 1 [Coccinella septempunctata]|uniref:UHRF1-binding protein 1 n=1 Tax=Coccinella septempunctata TaxID=41139 RepID=UPI001D08BB51|nr:UHRF1-binding protein 1 [Coccinella septempunctata]
MVSILKNQLLKHLQRFTKNLSADKINLSTFKGEGELSNLELNEIVLTDLLELPSFLRLTKAWCNKVSFRIPWTKLRSVPIHLNLDEVNITIETCEELRSMSAQSGLSEYAMAQGKYGYINKVIDGITVTVNHVNILFNSPAFSATIQISRILLESKSPKWEKADLRMTRLKEPSKGQLLIFKELEWQTLKIEAKSTKDTNLTPLRLITNQATCRIVIKKRLSDCFVMGSRLVIILEDLLWVLTDSQLKAALHFADSLTGLIQKATQITRKTKAARKLEELPEYQAQLQQEARTKESTSTSRPFAMNDVVETSYHFLCSQVVLHLCDDPGTGRSSHPNLKEGGALQVNVSKFQVDFYPYHLAKANRKHWPKYNDASFPHTQWQDQALSSFKTKFLDLINKNRTPHASLSRTAKTSQSEPKKMPSPLNTDVKQKIENQLAKLMTSCTIIRVDDFTVHKVTSPGKKQPFKEFVCGDRDIMQLPKESSIAHAEFIYYYYPDESLFPLPPPKFYVQINPVHVSFDIDTILWANSFGLNLYQSLMASKPELPSSNLTYIDVKIECILPRISFESNTSHVNQKDRPKILNFQVTRATVTNVRSLEQSSRADLAKCVDSFHMGSLFFGSGFPSDPSDFYIVTQKFLDHISSCDNIRNVPEELDTSSLNALMNQLHRELLWTEAKDVWCINLDPVWGEFLGARAVGISKPVPFLDAVPVTIWLHSQMDPNSTLRTNNDHSASTTADIHALTQISNLVSVQINHYQYLFLLRLAEELAELATFVSLDSNRIIKVESSGSLVVGALLPQVEVTFVMPSHCPGKESSGADAESFLPDSSSIMDDMLVHGSAATVWQNSSLSITQADHPPPKKSIPNGSSAAMTMSASHSMDYMNHAPPLKALSKERQETTVGAKSDVKTIQNNINEGLSSMKKGFSNFMSSIDSALKPGGDDASDTLSIRSDSSDSENYVVVNIADEGTTCDLMFSLKTNYDSSESGAAALIEMASEVIEEESTVTTLSEPSMHDSCRRKDLVSVATFKLSKVEFLHQSVGYSSSIKLQVGNIKCDDCNSIPWDEFQRKFSSRSRGWSDDPADTNTTPKVKLRLNHNLTLPNSKSMMELDFTDRENIKKLFQDNLIVKVDDLSLVLSMSVVTGLTDLIEDEIIQTPIPLQLVLNNVHITLNEDRPPANITSPGPVPVDLNICQLYITQQGDGVFNILPQPPNIASSTMSIVSAQEAEQQLVRVNKQLTAENEELQRRLVAFERVSEENRLLRKAKEEKETLKACLTSAQDEVMRLLDEKIKLLDDMKRLQDQLSERGRQWNSKR